jgi:two-component system response regulator (stage 0 sporulation protein F)
VSQIEEGLHRNPDLMPRKRQKILLVDDDLNDLLYYSAILQHEGYEVCSVASHREGAERLDRENFDFVITSQGTAAFEGRDVLARVVEKDRNIPTLVLSRSCDIDCYLEAMQMGAFDYQEKPLAAAELAEIVASLLRPLGFRAA